MKSIWIVINNIVNKGTKGLDYPNNFQMQNTIISDIKKLQMHLLGGHTCSCTLRVRVEQW